MEPICSLKGDPIYCSPHFDLWTVSYYWCIMLISGAAGGEIARGHFTASEQRVFVVLVVASALLWSEIIASFCGVISNLNPEVTLFQNRMDDLNRYMRLHRFDTHTRRRLREYMLQTKHLQVADAQRELLTLMSPKIQGELSLQVQGKWLRQVRFPAILRY